MNTSSRSSVERTHGSAARPLLLLALISAWPLVNFANVNRDKAFSVPVLAAFFAIVFGVSLILYLLLRRLLPRVPAGAWALAIAAGQVLFFGHGIVLPYLWRGLAFIGLGGGRLAWAAVIVIMLSLAAWLGTRRLAVTAATIGVATAVAMPAFDVTNYAVRRWRTARASAQPIAASPDGVVARPNVYFVIADAYDRSDTMKKYLGFDNTSYMDELRDLGFFVGRDARANYPMTFLALSSAFQMDYVISPSTPRYTDRSPFSAILYGDNTAIQTFKRLGYRYVQGGSGQWQETNCRGREDICIEKQIFGAGQVFRLGFGETEMALMEMTPVFKRYVAAARTRGIYSEAITTFAGLTKALRTVPVDAPIFVFAHSFPPHPPFIFGADCSVRDEVVTDYGPLRDRKDDPASQHRYRQLFAEQAECVSRQMIFFAREIVRKDPGAIVIIQSDHGSDTRVDWSARTPLAGWSAEALEERFSILNAIRVPDRCRQWQYDGMSPVNTFRLVLGCLQNRQPDFLPDRSFVAGYENHPDFGLVHEVTPVAR